MKTFSWGILRIERLDVSHIRLHWTLSGSDSISIKNSEGCVLVDESASGYVSYTGISESDVPSWVRNILGSSAASDAENALFLSGSDFPKPSELLPWPKPPITPDDIVKAMERLFDKTAQAKNYDNRITCALRAGYVGPFQAEGMAFATWMDSQNAKAYVMLTQVQAGTMPMPATVEDALALLDPMVWPA